MKITMELANEVNAMYGLPSVDKVLAMVDSSEVKSVIAKVKPVKKGIMAKVQTGMAKVRKAVSSHRSEKEVVNDFFKDLS